MEKYTVKQLSHEDEDWLDQQFSIVQGFEKPEESCSSDSEDTEENEINQLHRTIHAKKRYQIHQIMEKKNVTREVVMRKYIMT